MHFRHQRQIGSRNQWWLSFSPFQSTHSWSQTPYVCESAPACCFRCDHGHSVWWKSSELGCKFQLVTYKQLFSISSLAQIRSSMTNSVDHFHGNHLPKNTFHWRPAHESQRDNHGETHVWSWIEKPFEHAFAFLKKTNWFSSTRNVPFLLRSEVKYTKSLQVPRGSFVLFRLFVHPFGIYRRITLECK